MKALRQLYDFLGVPVSAPRNAPPAAGAADRAEPHRITARIEIALASDRQLARSPIRVEVCDGVVVLSGYADSEAEVARAVEIVSAIAGVDTVRNRLALAWW